MINRPAYMKRLLKAMKRSPVTALLGPRQCGKTTLARIVGKEKGAAFFDLESQPDRIRLQNPQLMLGGLKGLVILDEVQEMPELFQVLRVLVDRPDNKTKFLVLGSASPDIVKRTSETLAGRIEYVDLAGFDLWETGEGSSDTLWLRGGFPPSFLAESEEDSMAWRENFIKTFLERDIPHLGISIPPTAMRRFWMMLAHYHGQVWNAAEIGRSMGLTDKTVRSYLDILSGTFMVRQLQPWYENTGKRQVKAPKIYFRDSGLLHGLLGLASMHGLLGHPRVGASWEGFALEQVMQIMGQPEAFFWATHNGAEIDLMFFRQGRKFGIEFKFSEAPKITRSAQTALETLDLEHLWVVYPGEHQYPFSDRISVLPLKDAAEVIQRAV
jgi:uncharacterized protein